MASNSKKDVQKIIDLRKQYVKEEKLRFDLKEKDRKILKLKKELEDLKKENEELKKLIPSSGA